MKVLFLLKKNLTSGGYNYSTERSGLLNSARIVAEELQKELEIETVIEICVDGNEINKYVTLHKPNVCILEAIWATPAKLEELHNIHKNVTFIIRAHSRIPFIANEGIAFPWIKGYLKIPKVFVGFNSEETSNELNIIGIDNVYLPNLYPIDEATPRLRPISREINVGCFGAIRPMKNHLLQAVAALRYAEKSKKTINFHVNAGRTEQKGDNVLKNLRALFEGTRHTLVEHPWMGREEFLELVSSMDIGLQVSMSESFNIVAADFVKQGRPIIVCTDISWMPSALQVDDKSSEEIASKMKEVLNYRHLYTTWATIYLRNYNKQALKEWRNLLT